MTNNSKNIYFVKKSEDDTVFRDITMLFDGVAVLKLDGILQRGKPVNVYTAQWVSSQKEDFLITKTDEDDRPLVIRENVDIDLTFIVRQKYATSTIDVLSVHDAFAEYMTESDVWLKTAYTGNKYVHCVCLKEYKPTTVRLDRGENSYIMGTITLHCLDAPTSE